MTTAHTFADSPEPFRTTEAYVSGGICGSLWMPAVLGGIPLRANLRDHWGIMDRFTEPASFRDALDSLLMEKGGDFQNPQFTADTRLCVIRRRTIAPGRQELHVWERDLTDCATLTDLVNPDAYTGDFFDHED